MAANKENKVTKGETKGEKRSLMSIAEVRMLFYVVPIATILALFVYFTTK